MTTIRPLNDRVVIKRIGKPEAISPGGIVLPEVAREKPQEGEVIAVGPGKQLEDGTRSPLTVAKGDRVLIPKFGGVEVALDGEDFVIIREEEILGVIEGV